MIDIRHGLVAIGLACSGILSGGSAPAMAADSAQSDRQLLKFAAGDSRDVFGLGLHATAPATAVLLTSSELITVAVLRGEISAGKLTAHAGQALVMTIDGGSRLRRFGFDAQRLAATLPPDWAGEAAAPLARLAVQQRHRRFWGLDEPARINASAPARANLEAIRATYLGNDTVVALRREAQGKPDVLATLTAKRFAAALAARDMATVADLIDPKPFTDTGADAGAWQAARGTFAEKLVDDAALVAAMASEPAGVANDQTAFDAGGYRIRLIPRDRAMFVTSVEAL